MSMTTQSIEIMAPAGSWASLAAALQSGANSVYFGVEHLNMRANSAKTFTLEDLSRIARICAEKSVKTYLTVNTVIYDEDMEMMRKVIDAAKEAGISAVIAADVAVMQYARRRGVEVHLSTQLNISNVAALRFYAQFADVVVLARELNLRQVKVISQAIRDEKICGPSGELIRIEMFCHGALCMAVSGKCYLSLHTRGPSANRGACLQNCRRKYRVFDTERDIELEVEDDYIWSPKDLKTIEIMKEMIEAGVSVFKIEGRARGPEYVATVVKSYRAAADAVLAGTFTEESRHQWDRDLARVFNRGFWEGLYLGRKTSELSGGYGSHATEKKVFTGKTLGYYGQVGVGYFLIQTGEIKTGDKIMVIGPTSGVVECIVEDMRVNDQPGTHAQKGDKVTFKVPGRIRENDQLYKIIPASENPHKNVRG